VKAEPKKGISKDDDMLRESSGKLRRVMEVSFLSFNFAAAMVSYATLFLTVHSTEKP
jgi:hypothetical protein